MAKNIPNAIRFTFLIDRSVKDTVGEACFAGKDLMLNVPPRIEAHLA
ncbi:hypothetical protein CES85_2963 (plasmid) [Ochrobactrum quorumnocens]|uniref:Uncharacterized protein n=1 Tax=Ochrobactrum quorumnocens TaxID=271865 RepID=A0A248UPW9_9HYPH|nr:hypothetical protein CES85_2963 [[Ochrobactrum] quorumnocens]